MGKDNAAAPAPADEQAGAATNDVDLVTMSKDEILATLEPQPAPAADEAEDDAEAVEDESDGDEESSESESEDESEDEGEDEEGDEDEESDEDEEADEAAAASEEAPPKKLTPEQIEKLWVSNQQLLGLKGRQGQKIHDKDQRIAQLESELATARGEKPQTETEPEEEFPKTKQEWEDLYNTDPLKATHLFYRMQRQAEMKQAEAARLQEQAQRVQATPFVGADIFIQERGIENFDDWSDTEEGLAVLEVIGGNRTTKLAMLAAVNTGDAEGVAEILGNGLDAVRKNAVATKGKKVQKVVAKKVEATKARSLPRPARRVHPVGDKPIGNYSKEEILGMSNKQFRRVFGGVA